MSVQYRCPRCSQAMEWTDGRSVEAGDEVDEYWCQYCGEESPLADCERLDWVVSGPPLSAWSPAPWELS